MDSLVTAISSMEGPLPSLQSRSLQSASEDDSASSTADSGIISSSAPQEEKPQGKRSAASLDSAASKSSKRLAATRTVKDLKERCRTAGLAVSGTKQELTARLDFIRTTSTASTVECPTFRMASLPLHAGTVRQGSLRVIANSSNTTAANKSQLEARLQPVRDNIFKIIPGNTPIAVSVLRHDNVFNSDPEFLRRDPTPVCPCCGDPAEVFDVHRPIPLPAPTNISPLVSQLTASQESSLQPPSQLSQLDEEQDAKSFERTQSQTNTLTPAIAVANPVYAHLHALGVVSQGPTTYLRVCRKGCLSYQDIPAPSTDNASCTSSKHNDPPVVSH